MRVSWYLAYWFLSLELGSPINERFLFINSDFQFRNCVVQLCFGPDGAIYHRTVWVRSIRVDSLSLLFAARLILRKKMHLWCPTSTIKSKMNETIHEMNRKSDHWTHSSNQNYVRDGRNMPYSWLCLRFTSHFYAFFVSYVLTRYEWQRHPLVCAYRLSVRPMRVAILKKEI